MPAGVRIRDREVFLLSMLINQKLYGYQIARMLKDHASFFIDMDQSSVYNALRKLEKEGWVSVELEKAGNAPIRKIYQMTPEGKNELKTFLLGEPNQRRLNILGTLNLLMNSSWLPSDKLKKHLSGRVAGLQGHINDQAGSHEGHTDDPTSKYLKALMQIEIDFATDLLKKD
jgi:DNA-binding PadR family transcriptional regulator